MSNWMCYICPGWIRCTGKRQTVKWLVGENVTVWTG